MNKPVLCMDFDGVIHSYDSGWVTREFIPDPPVPGAFKFLLEAIDVFDVQIFSSRSSTLEGRAAMSTWIEYWARKELPNDEASGYAANKLINALCHRAEAWPTEKPPAMITIDDRAINFDGSWPSIDSLRGFKPWNKK